MSKILVVVPHEDDELSVAGQMLYTFAKDPQNECFVILTTDETVVHGKMPFE